MENYNLHLKTAIHKKQVKKQEKQEQKNKSIDNNSFIQQKQTNWIKELSACTSQEQLLETIKLKQDSTTPLQETDCLFCSKKSKDLSQNYKHMLSSHGLFIHDFLYINQKEYFDILQERVNIHNLCLYCHSQDKTNTFYSLESVRKHMVTILNNYRLIKDIVKLVRMMKN